MYVCCACVCLCVCVCVTTAVGEGANMDRSAINRALINTRYPTPYLVSLSTIMLLCPTLL